MKVVNEVSIKKRIEQGHLDIFELLRMLNSKNITENEELRDELFTTLSVVEEIDKFETSYNYDKNINTKSHYSNELGSVVELSGTTLACYDYFMLLSHINVDRFRLKIKDKYVLLDFTTTQGNGSYDNNIARLLLYMENYVKSSPEYFDSFKLKLIEILIRNVCEQYVINYANQEDKERKMLNKLMNIYLECKKKLEPSKEYSDLITPELVEQLRLEANRSNHGKIITDYIVKKHIETEEYNIEQGFNRYDVFRDEMFESRKRKSK